MENWKEGPVIDITVPLDRIQCLNEEFTKIINSREYTKVKLVISKYDIYITPIADETKIVLIKNND